MILSFIQQVYPKLHREAFRSHLRPSIVQYSPIVFSLKNLSSQRLPKARSFDPVTEVRPMVRFGKFCHRAPTESKLLVDTLQFGLLLSSLLSNHGQSFRKGFICSRSLKWQHARHYLTQGAVSTPLQTVLVFWQSPAAAQGQAGTSAEYFTFKDTRPLSQAACELPKLKLSTLFVNKWLFWQQ